MMDHLTSQTDKFEADIKLIQSCDCNNAGEKWTDFIEGLKSDGNMNIVNARAGPPLDILFPEDLDNLRGELKTLKNENLLLSKKLQASEDERELLKEEIDISKKLRNPVTGSQIATSKIVELSKKIRELTAELGASKLHCKQLENVVKRFSAMHEDGANVQGDASQLEDQKKLHKQIETLQLKLFRSRNEYDKLKGLLESAYKVIEKEVGQEAEIVLKNFNEDNESWKGKAEEISALRLKVAELNEKLNMRQSCFMINRNKVNSLEAKIKEMKLEHQREVQEFKTQIEDFKKSNVGAKARYHVLEGELNVERNKIKILSEKSNTDDEMIGILKKKVKTNISERSKEKELNKGMESQISALKIEMEQIKTQCNNLVSALGERDSRIRQQDEKIEAFYRTKEIYGDTITDDKSIDLKTMLAGVEDERDHLKMELESNQKLLKEMREHFIEAAETIKIEKQKYSKLEEKTATFKNYK